MMDQKTINMVPGRTNKSVELIAKLSPAVIDKNLPNVVKAIHKIDTTCDYAKCKAKTNLMGQTCDLCRQRFCFKHGLPEVHGCGQAVKQGEREKFLHPKPMKTVRQEQELKDAHKRLSTKLKDMKIGRMPKPSTATNKNI